ncbi:MAG: hypothetical protein WA802_05295 [Terracidiphilus sp.]
MTGNRSKGAWIWVAMAAISFASLARVQSGVENARAYAHPVIKFLAASNQTDLDATVRAHHAKSLSRTCSYGINLNLLAVFVGLVTPLKLESTADGLSLGRMPAALSFSALFQRPPPLSLA